MKRFSSTSLPAYAVLPSIWQLIAPWALIAGCFVAYFGTGQVPFLMDGRYFIEQDRAIRDLWDPATYMLGTSRPLTRLTFAINYSINQLNPFGYHLVNLTSHALAALALYGLIRRSLSSPRFAEDKSVPGAGLAMSAALVWALHPLQTASVTYIFQRAEVLMGLFYLSTLYFLSRALGSEKADVHWKILAIFSCCLGMASKAIMLTAPILAVLYDRFFWARSWKEIWVSRRRFYAVMALSWVIPVFIGLEKNESMQTIGLSGGLPAPLQYAGYQAVAMIKYLKLAFWPFNLVFHYGYPPPGGLAEIAASSFAVAALLAAAVWLATWRPRLGFVALSFFIILIPTSSFFPIADIIFEHRMYLPLAPAAVFSLYCVYRAAARCVRNPMLLKKILTVSVAVLVASLCVRTMHRNSLFQTRERIWSDVLSKRPDNGFARLMFSRALIERGRYDEGIQNLQLALTSKKYPWRKDYLNFEIYCNLAEAYGDMKNFRMSIEYFRKALDLRPGDEGVRCNVAMILASDGRVHDAIQEIEEGLRLDPKSDMLHQHAGRYFERLGRIDEAVDHFQKAVSLAPNVWVNHYSLGKALAISGRPEEGLDHLYIARQLAPEGSDVALKIVENQIRIVEFAGRIRSGGTTPHK